LHGLKLLPDYDVTKPKQPGIHRVLSFVADILNDRPESRSTCHSLNIPKILVHHDKQDAKEIHERWLLSLSEGTAIMYTDGSRTNDGYIGAGWSIGLISNGKIQFMIDGFCYLGMKMEVYDAEPHVVLEGLKAILLCNFKPGVLRICIDNSASVLALSDPTSNDESCSKAKITSDTLISHEWDIGLVWTPNHLDIDGNEREDQLAKKGSAANTPECNDHYTSKAWLHRRAKEHLMLRWKTEIGMTSATWKYPFEWENWSFRDSKAIFGIYCGRTEVDPRPNNDDKPCQCGIDLISSDNLISKCRLLEKERERIYGLNIAPPLLSKKMILDKDFGPGIRGLAKKNRPNIR
jgi:hypothetical protein